MRSRHWRPNCEKAVPALDRAIACVRRSPVFTASSSARVFESSASFEEFVREHWSDFREVVLLDDREAAVERFDDRARTSDDPWIRHHHRLIGLRGGAVVLETMYDDLLEVVRRRPGAVVVPSAVGEVQETYRLPTAVLGEKS